MRRITEGLFYSDRRNLFFFSKNKVFHPTSFERARSYAEHWGLSGPDLASAIEGVL